MGRGGVKGNQAASPRFDLIAFAEWGITFFFQNGQYASYPYTIRREGYAYYLNDIQIRRLDPIPVGYTPRGPTPPQLPADITAASSWDNVEKVQINGKPWVQIYPTWFYYTYPKEEASKRIVEEFQKLPFVKTAEWTTWERNKKSQYLRVVSNAGDERHLFTSWWNPKNHSGFDKVWGPPEKEDFAPSPHSDQYMETVRAALEKGLTGLKKKADSGDIHFRAGLSYNIELRKDNPAQWQEIVNVVAILESKLSREQKIQELSQHLPSSPTDRDNFRPDKVISNLVDNFQSDPQLTKRVEELRKNVTIPLWQPPGE